MAAKVEYPVTASVNLPFTIFGAPVWGWGLSFLVLIVGLKTAFGIWPEEFGANLGVCFSLAIGAWWGSKQLAETEPHLFLMLFHSLFYRRAYDCHSSTVGKPFVP